MRPLVLIAFLQGLLMLVGLARGKSLATLLSPSGFGVVGAIDQLVLTIVQLGMLGLPFVALKYMSQANSVSNSEFRRVAEGFALALLALGTFWTLLLVALLSWSPTFLGPALTPYSEHLRIAAIAIPANILSIFTVNALAAGQQPIRAAGLNLFVALGVTVSTIVAVLQSGLAGFFVGLAIAAVGTIFACVLVLHLNYGINPLRLGRAFRSSVLPSRAMTTTTAGLYLALAFSAASMFAVRYIVIDVLGESTAGFYQSAMSIALTVGALITPIANFYLVPILNQQTDGVEKARVANDFMHRMTLLLLLGALPISCFPILVLDTLFSPAFRPTASVLFLFVAWQCLFQIAYVLQQVLIGLDDTNWVAILALFGFGGSAVLALLLVPEFGLGGAAAALLLGTGFYLVILSVRLWLKHRVALFAKAFQNSSWMLAAVISIGYLSSSGEEFSPQGFALRVSFLTVAGLLTWYFAHRYRRETKSSST